MGLRLYGEGQLTDKVAVGGIQVILIHEFRVGILHIDEIHHLGAFLVGHVAIVAIHQVDVNGGSPLVQIRGTYVRDLGTHHADTVHKE